MTQFIPPATALVVETNSLIASVIEAPLVEHGYHVLVASSHEDALHLLETVPIDLALVDFRLRQAGPDGLVTALGQRGIPYIFCTAASVDEVVEVFPGARVVSKPFSDEDLLATVASLVPQAVADAT